MRCQRRYAWFARAAWLSVLWLLLLIVPAGNGTAQPQSQLKNVVDTAPKEAVPSAAEKSSPVLKVFGPPDDYDRGVPRNSVTGFFSAARTGDYERAAQYLDLRGLPQRMRDIPGEEMARQLKIVLDRTLLIDPELLSADPQGHKDDGLPPARDLLGQIKTDAKKYTLLLQHVPREDGVLIWKVSNATVAEIPELYAQFRYGRLGEFLSDKMPEVEVLGAMLWQWAAFIVLIALTFVAVFLPTWLAALLLQRRGTDKMIQAARFIRGPLRLLFWVLLMRSLSDMVSPTMTMRATIRAGTLLIIAIAWSRSVCQTSSLPIRRPGSQAAAGRAQ
jgi:MscS family membrane protein